jgi:hypothetical protein
MREAFLDLSQQSFGVCLIERFSFMVGHGVTLPVANTTIPLRLKLGRSDRQHKKDGRFAVVDLTITGDLTDLLKFSLHFPTSRTFVVGLDLLSCQQGGLHHAIDDARCGRRVLMAVVGFLTGRKGFCRR